MVRGGAVRYGTVQCGVVWCGAGFCGPWCWVWQVKYSSFWWLVLLISDISDHALVFLVVEQIFIVFRKGLCQQVLQLSEHVIVFFHHI